MAKARWRKEPPSQPQCEHLWYRDPVVRKRFSNGAAFCRFARYQFEKGNKAFSKGAISQRIEIAKLRPPRYSFVLVAKPSNDPNETVVMRTR